MKTKNLVKILAMALICAMLIPALFACGATHKDWEEIGPKGKMIIGVTEFEPMNYKDADGKWIGFETEFAQAVCEILGVEAEFQIIKWQAKETELKAKNIDAVWNGMTVTPDREKEMDLSQHYMINRQVLVTLAENADKYQTADDMDGVNVVAENGSTGEETASGDEMDPFFAKAKYTAVDSQAKALLDVKAGVAQVAVVDYLIAANAMGEGTDFANLVISPYKSFADEEYAIAFRKDSPETLKKVNDAINQLIGNGKLQEIADKYGLGDLLIKG